ncbi:MmgE/PrpD family protein [Bacillus sp. Marseille-P3661]|uniref:MmgE/PrpD family protein n=1 Tax=Bacillus sp. Marseille-P3661 TaxID=1936234 RepID=UPI000C83D948|nr:MmgE/PrpD family protein [Bacillus sp. Marseille-P3661]
MSVLKQVSSYISTHKHSKLEREEALNHFVDTIVALVCGRYTTEGEHILSVFQDEENGILSTNHVDKQSVLDEIMINVSLTRLTEVDDIHIASCTTPGSVIIPTVLSLTPTQKNLSYETIMDSIIIGYDMMTRLGQVIDGARILSKGIWPTYFTAAFGAAATTSRLLGLPDDKTVHALALSLTMSTGGVSRSSQHTFRWLTLGTAVRSGVLAAIIASKGFQGDPEMLENSWLEKTYGLKAELSYFTNLLGEENVMQRMSMKPYCSAKQVIPSIYGLSKILEQGILPEEIKSINIKVPNEFVKMIDHGASDRVSSLTSAPYQLAMSVYYPEHLFDISRTELIKNDIVHSFMNRVKIYGDETLSKHYPEQWMTIVEVETTKGTVIEVVDNSHGDSTKKLNKKDIMQKSLKLLQPILKNDEIQEFIKLIESGLTDKQAVIDVTKQVKILLK